MLISMLLNLGQFLFNLTLTIPIAETSRKKSLDTVDWSFDNLLTLQFYIDHPDSVLLAL